MLQEIIDLFPDSIRHAHASGMLALAGAGLCVALVGARFSRAIVCLALVAGGAVFGLCAPRWFGWGIEPMGGAFAGAIVLGITGYVLTTVWEGICLAVLFAVGFGLSVWLHLAPHEAWHVPSVDWSQTALEIAGRIRLSLPRSLVNILPVMLGVGATVGALITVIAPRLGRALLYSLLGLGLAVGGSFIGLSQVHRDWLAMIPNDAATQGLILGVALAAFTGIQFFLQPTARRDAAAAKSDNNSAPSRKVARNLATQAPLVRPRTPHDIIRPAELPMRSRKISPAGR